MEPSSEAATTPYSPLSSALVDRMISTMLPNLNTHVDVCALTYVRQVRALCHATGAFPLEGLGAAQGRAGERQVGLPA